MAKSSMRKLMDNLAELSTVPSQAAKAIAKDIDARLAAEFVEKRDPYGDKWADNAPSTIARKGRNDPMVDTGRTARETGARPQAGAGVEIFSTPEAGYNQFERDNVPARPVLPSRKELPEEWQEIVDKRVDQAMKRAMKKG